MSSELGAGSDQNSALIVTWGPRWGCSWKVIPSQLEASSMSTSVHIIVCFLWFLWSSHQHRLHCRGSIPWANTSSPPLMRLGWAMGRWFTKQRRLWSTDFQSKVRCHWFAHVICHPFCYQPEDMSWRLWDVRNHHGVVAAGPAQNQCFSSVYCGTLLPWKETQGTAHIFLDLVDDSRGNDFQVPVTSSPSPPSGRRKVTQDQFMVTWLRRLLFQPHLTYCISPSMYDIHSMPSSVMKLQLQSLMADPKSSVVQPLWLVSQTSSLFIPIISHLLWFQLHPSPQWIWWSHNWSKPPWCG